MIAIISNDAGGAEIVSSYVREQRLNCRFVLDGPARDIFERKLGPLKLWPLDEAIQKSKWTLCSTGGRSELNNAIRMARSLGKHSVAFLDHWVNYRERFIRSGNIYLPNEIWVGDSMAEAIAKRTFPDALVRFVDNPYFRDIRKELATINSGRVKVSDGLSVLYVCEPVREHALQLGEAHNRGYVEEDALHYFLANIAALGKPIERIVIRPHPSERADKYQWALREPNLNIVQGGWGTLVEEVADSDVVVGCESMAMVVGLLAGKQVISCIPPHGKPCALPHPEIAKLHTLINTSATS